MKFRIDPKLADDMDKLFKSGMLVTDDGAKSREIARVLVILRRNGRLVVGKDRRMNKSILMVNGVKKKGRRNSPLGKSIFDVYYNL